MLTDACSLKELCEFVLADSMTLSNAAKVEDIAYRTGSDALARLCGRLRYMCDVCVFFIDCNSIRVSFILLRCGKDYLSTTNNLSFTKEKKNSWF